MFKKHFNSEYMWNKNYWKKKTQVVDIHNGLLVYDYGDMNNLALVIRFRSKFITIVIIRKTINMKSPNDIEYCGWSVNRFYRSRLLIQSKSHCASNNARNFRAIVSSPHLRSFRNSNVCVRLWKCTSVCEVLKRKKKNSLEKAKKLRANEKMYRVTRVAWTFSRYTWCMFIKLHTRRNSQKYLRNFLFIAVSYWII